MPCPIVFTDINIPINIDMRNTFVVYFQIFATFGYKKVKNSEVYHVTHRFGESLDIPAMTKSLNSADSVC